MISYPTTETRTCDKCCVRKTTDPGSSLCARCLTEMVHALFVEPQDPRPKPKPRPLTPWERLKDWLFILWYSRVPRGHCVRCGMRKADCACGL